MEKVKVILLGAAHEDAVAWARSLASQEEAEVAAFWDHDAERGERTASALGIRFQADLEKALAERNPAAVCIAVETSRRAELIAKAAAAGKRVLSAAPMAVSLEQHDRLLKSEADRTPGQGNGGCMVVPYFPMRFDPLSQRVRAMLTGGKLGKVDVVRLRLGSNQAATPGFSKSWFANAEVSGGGVFMDHGIHAVDFLHWLLGEPLDVVAQVGSSLLNLPVEDSIIAVYRFPRNVIAEVACSWVWHAATNTVEAYGEAGTLLVQGNDPASRDFTHDEFGRIYCNDFQERRWQSVETKSTFRSEEFHSRAVKAFVEFVQGRAPLPMGMRECRAALAMVLGAYESARQGRRMVFTTGGSSAAGGAMGFRPE